MNLIQAVTGAPSLALKLAVLHPASQSYTDTTRAAEQSHFQRMTDMLAGVYAFGLEALKNKDALRELGKEHRITFPGQASNLNWWLPIIKIATGHYDETETFTRKDPDNDQRTLTHRVFHPGKQLQKYAGALRFIEEKGWAPDDLEENVGGHKFKSGSMSLTQWSAVVSEDRDVRKKAGKATSRKMHDDDVLKAAAERLLRQAPADVRSVASVAGADYGMAWGYWSEGVFVLGARVPDPVFNAKAKTFAVKYETESMKADEAEGGFDTGGFDEDEFDAS